MAMTRKDYNRIAYYLAMQEPELLSDNNDISQVRMQHEVCCSAVAQALVGTNPRLRKEYFLEACKFSYWENRKLPR